MTDDPRPQGFLTRLRGDRRGVSAVEFALLAPIMISFYFGLAELCQGYMSQKRLGHTASAVGDLVAQSSTVTKDQIDDMIGIGALVMKPFDATTLTTRITSVTRNTSGVAKVNWSRASGIAPLHTNDTVTVPTGVIANNESLIMAESTYDYSSPIKYLLPSATKFSSVFYLRPRLVATVPCTDCPAT
ncbi:pilus assembly protein [soil metagenome]